MVLISPVTTETVQPQLLQHSGYSHNCTNQLLQPQLSLYGSGYSHNCPAFKGPVYATMLTKRATVFRKIYELSSQRLLLGYMTGKKGHNHSVDTRSFHRSSWNCSQRWLFNKHHGAGILKRKWGEPQQQKSSQVKPQLEPTSRSSGRCEFSRFIAAKHEAGTLVRTSVCETSLTWISLQKFVYTGEAIRMNHQHRLLSKQIHL